MDGLDYLIPLMRFWRKYRYIRCLYYSWDYLFITIYYMIFYYSFAWFLCVINFDMGFLLNVTIIFIKFAIFVNCIKCKIIYITIFLLILYDIILAFLFCHRSPFFWMGIFCVAVIKALIIFKKYRVTTLSKMLQFFL